MYRPNERKKYVNIFDGLDNTKMMGFDQLKKATFREIFTCKNDNAKSIKKALNFLNYTNEHMDIITKKDRNPAFTDFNQLLVQYEPIKPPVFDLQANLALAKKR